MYVISRTTRGAHFASSTANSGAFCASGASKFRLNKRVDVTSIDRLPLLRKYVAELCPPEYALSFIICELHYLEWLNRSTYGDQVDLCTVLYIRAWKRDFYFVALSFYTLELLGDN